MLDRVNARVVELTLRHYGRHAIARALRDERAGGRTAWTAEDVKAIQGRLADHFARER